MNYFAYPAMFGWLAVVIALWLAGSWLKRRRLKVLQILGEPPTIRRMFPAGLSRRRRWARGLQIVGLFSVVIALAGPLIGSKLVEYKQKGMDVFIAVDCSLSMLAEDFKPSRMAHAKLILGQLIDKLGGNRIGIIAFAGQAYVQCPLTVDDNAAKDILDTIDVGSVPIPGTVIGEAIRVTMKGLKAGEGQNRILILLTDGEDHRSDPQGAAKDAAQAGLKIYAIGIGSPEGEPIPVFDDQGNRTGYKRDKKGEVVLSKLDEASLIAIAHDTGGRYFRASPAGDEVEELARELEKLQQGDQKTRMFNRFENRYQWPLAFGLVLLLVSLMIPEMGWRRLLIFAFCLLPCRSWASQSQLKEGNRQFKNGNYEKALKLYEDALVDTPYSSMLHYNAGDAVMMQGDFPKAEVSFMEAAKSANPVLKGASHYNRGNSLFYQGKWADAVEAYKDSLRANPQDMDAKYNLGVALRAQKNPPPPKSGQNKQDQDKGGGKGDKKDQKDGQGSQNQRPQMSKEDAERLLAAAGAGEKKKGSQKMQKGDLPHPDEDW